MRGSSGFSYRTVAVKLEIPDHQAPRCAGPGSGWVHQRQPLFADTACWSGDRCGTKGIVPCRKRNGRVKQSGGGAGWRNHGFGVLRPSVGDHLLELRVGEENVIDIAALDGLVRS